MANRGIRLEEQGLLDAQDFEKVLRLVPIDPREDIHLRRFLAFRLKLDGRVATLGRLIQQMA